MAADRPCAKLPEAPKREPEISDGRVPSPAERAYKPDLAGIPASIRRDHSKLQSVLAAQAFGPEEGLPDMSSWDELQQRGPSAANDGKVSFHAAPSMAAPGYDHLGRPTGRWRGGRSGGLRG